MVAGEPARVLVNSRYFGPVPGRRVANLGLRRNPRSHGSTSPSLLSLPGLPIGQTCTQTATLHPCPLERTYLHSNATLTTYHLKPHEPETRRIDSAGPRAARTSSAQQGGAIGEPIVLQTTSLPKGFLRQPYHFKLEAQGGILPLKWEITAGAQPPGVDLSIDGNLTGAPTEVDSFHFIVTITDSGKPARSQKKEFTIDVVAPLVVEWSKKPKVNGPQSGRRDQSLQPDRPGFRFHLYRLSRGRNRPRHRSRLPALQFEEEHRRV